MATADQIRTLIMSHFENDKERFITAALQMAAYEARQGHTMLAQNIRELIDKSKNISNKVIPLNRDLDELILSIQSHYHFPDLIVPEKLKMRIERILREYHEQEKLRKHGLSNRRKILLTGLPGTGKTMTAAVIAAELHLPFYIIQMDRLVTKFMGETSAKLRQIFEIIEEKRGVFLFDEFDAIGAERGLDNDVGEMRRVLNSFLQFIEHDKSRSLIIAATNNLSLLDQALFRRFEDVLIYNLPTKEEVLKLIENRLCTFKINFYIDDIVTMANNLSHAEITQACDDAIKDSILNDRLKIAKEQIIAALNERHIAYKERKDK